MPTRRAQDMSHRGEGREGKAVLATTSLSLSNTPLSKEPEAHASGAFLLQSLWLLCCYAVRHFLTVCILHSVFCVRGEKRKRMMTLTTSLTLTSFVVAKKKSKTRSQLLRTSLVIELLHSYLILLFLLSRRIAVLSF